MIFKEKFAVTSIFDPRQRFLVVTHCLDESNNLAKFHSNLTTLVKSLLHN